jgi:hypothetical protein
MTLLEHPRPTAPTRPAPAGPPIRNGRRAALVGALVAILLGLLVAQAMPPAGPGAPTPVALAAGVTGLGAGQTASVLTKNGAGEFADLKVTVGQTADLVNQTVAVSWAWAGADKHPTRLQGATFQANYLQIMQCWGDTAPDRSNCEFGGFDFTGGSASDDTSALGRTIYPPSLTPAGSAVPIDPAESAITQDSVDYVKPGVTNPEVLVPFTAVNQEKIRYIEGLSTNPFFSEITTNEIPQARTRPDGTGFETFEALTFRESDGLGCADILAAGPKRGTPRSCWLVVVPRGETDVDGRRYTDFINQRLQSSPLSESNWKNRIVFPLRFQPVGQPCPLGAAQRPVGGVETSSEAVLRWQPALCRGGGTVFSYTKLSDAVVETGLTGADAAGAGLSFVNSPVAPDAVPADRTLVYAPIAVSGVAIAALVERRSTPDSPQQVADRQGERVTDLRLTPRLVAKLLTHSYQSSVHPRARYLAQNPDSIERDPEFLALNPEFAVLGNTRLELRVPTGVSFTTLMLWRWIAADQEARDFVAGLPDPAGMTVNPFYQGTEIPQETFPKVDPFCDRVRAFPDLPLCQLDLHPYVADFFEAAQSVARGVSGERVRNIAVVPPVSAAAPRQRPGERNLLGITDTPTTARFLMPTVKLRNAAGQFVAPTTASMQAAVAAMQRTAVPGVTVADPESASAAAYPLTTITYAVAPPNQFTVAAAREYADFIRFAVGPGQRPGTAAGTLPAGYAPLSAGLRKQALQAAARIQARVGPAASPTQPPVTSSTTPSTSSSSSSPAASLSPGPSASPSTPAAIPTPTATPTATALAARTPGDSPVPAWARYAMVAALLLGAGGLLIAPSLPRLAERFRR